MTSGFNYNFDSLNAHREPDKLYVVFRTVFNFRPKFTLANLFVGFLPLLRPYIVGTSSSPSYCLLMNSSICI